MDMNYEIVKVQGREILDSRGNPTVEAEVWLEGGAVGRASVPSGASTGAFEAAELRDGGGRYMGKGVKKAAEHVGNELAEAVMFESVLNQRRIDGLLLEAEGSSNKNEWGPTPCWRCPWPAPEPRPTRWGSLFTAIWAGFSAAGFRFP